MSRLVGQKGIYNQHDGTTDSDTWGLFYDIPPKEEVSSLDSIRSEMRKLYRTNQLFNGMVNTMCDRVIGSGLELQSTIQTSFLKTKIKNIDKIENEIEHRFTLFSKSKVDTTDRFNFGEIQRQIYLNYFMMGEVFIILDYQNKELKLQVIDPELCPLENGIEIDSSGKIVLYRFKKSYESTELISFKPTQVFNGIQIPSVIHYANTPRHELYRGIPKLAPAINPIKHMNEYLNEEVTHARVTNKLTYVFQNKEEIFSPEQRDKIEKNMLINLSKNNLTLVDKNSELKSIAPPQKKDNFESFISTLMTHICSSFMPQEVLFSDYDSNYSASRGAVMDSRQKIAIIRNHFSDVVMNPIYSVFFIDLLTQNKIQADSFFQDASIRQAWLSSEWVGENVGHIDPTKEIAFIEKAINLKIMSKDDGIKRINSRKDFPKVNEEISKESDSLPKTKIKQTQEESHSSEKSEKDRQESKDETEV